MVDSQQRTEMDEYWNGLGGTKWIENLSHIERVFAPISEILIDSLSQERKMKVLEVGCGGAALAAKLAKLIGPEGEVTASDISRPILDVAQKNCTKIPNLDFLCADVELYPFESRRFNSVISRFGVMFFTNPLAAFQNIHRSMAVGGQVNLLCWKSFDENLWMKIPAMAAFEILEKPNPPKKGEPGPFSLADEGLVKDLLANAGFDSVGLSEIKVDLNLGQLDEATHLMTQLGPAGRPFLEASKNNQEIALDLIRQALSKSDSGQNVVLPAACWLIQATA